MKLYEITAQHKELEKLAETDDEAIAQAVKDTFESIEGDFEAKAISLIYVVNNMSPDIAGIDNEVKRLQARKKTIENAQASMKEYLRSNMEATGITKITCPIFTITLAKGRDIVQIDDEDKIPPEFLNIKTTMSPALKEILPVLKAGTEVAGASLGKSRSSIRIK